MKKIHFYMLLALTAITIGCGGNKKGDKPEGSATKDLILSDDKTVYGLACDGCNDSVIWLYPGEGKDPVKYEIIDASRQKKVIGKIKIGDWIGLVLNEQDSTVADFVIDLDQLKGSWCYIVMPQMREYDKLSKKQQARMERDMPDSLKERYLIPREYGFTLKRQFQAQSIGYVRSSSSLEDESPVVYPTLPRYIKWHILNGKLILTRNVGKIAVANKDSKDATPEEPKTENDTINVLFMNEDSLVLQFKDHQQSYYRISKGTEANKVAREKAEKLAKEALHNVTNGNTADDNASEEKIKAAQKK